MILIEDDYDEYDDYDNYYNNDDDDADDDDDYDDEVNYEDDDDDDDVNDGDDDADISITSTLYEKEKNFIISPKFEFSIPIIPILNFEIIIYPSFILRVGVSLTMEKER